MRQVPQYICICLLFMSTIGGCRQGTTPAELPDTVPVSGVVNLDGKPIDGGVVTFLPLSQKGYRATGIINISGEYKLTTSVGSVSRPGAIPGDYTVTVSRFLAPSGELQDPSQPAEIPGRESLPLRYSDPLQSQMKATVGQAGESHDFQVKSK